jgi:DNA-binding Lrp family transcriptional regulator
MLDKTDVEILSALRADARASFRTLSKKLRLHPTTVISRIKKMEKTGVISGYSPNLDLTALGYEFLGLVQIKMTKGSILETQEKISKLKGVVAVWDVTGEYDGVVLIAAKTREEFSKVIKSFSAFPHVEHSSTQVVLHVVKEPWEFSGA